MLCTKEQLLPHCTNDGGNARAPVRCYFQLLLAFICQNQSPRKASSITHTYTIVPKEYPHPTPGPSWPDLLVQVVFAFLTLIFSSDQHQSAGVETCEEKGEGGGIQFNGTTHCIWRSMPTIGRVKGSQFSMLWGCHGHVWWIIDYTSEVKSVSYHCNALVCIRPFCLDGLYSWICDAKTPLPGAEFKIWPKVYSEVGHLRSRL